MESNLTSVTYYYGDSFLFAFLKKNLTFSFLICKTKTFYNYLTSIYAMIQDLALSRYLIPSSFCDWSALRCRQDSKRSLPPLPMPLGPPNAITMGLCLEAPFGSCFRGLWYSDLTARFQVLLFGFDFLKYFLYFNSDPRDLESTPLLFPNKNQAGNKHIAFEMVVRFFMTQKTSILTYNKNYTIFISKKQNINTVEKKRLFIYLLLFTSFMWNHVP